MEKRVLGNTGVEVSVLSVGAAAMGGEFGPRRLEESVRTVHHAIDVGINYFDTSPYYGRTKSETVLGQALVGKRDQVVLSTKTGRFDAAEFDFSASRVRHEVDRSLRRLQTDHVDLLIAHDVEFADPAEVLNEGLPTLLELKKAGKTRFVGVSGLPLAVLDKVVDHIDVDFVLSYCHYSLNDTALVPYAEKWRKKGLGVISASPLSMGLLTKQGPPDWHPSDDEIKRVVQKAADHCNAKEADLSFLSMQYAYQTPLVDTTMTGASRMATLEANIEALNTPIDATLLAEVEAILAPIKDKTWASGDEAAWAAYRP